MHEPQLYRGLWPQNVSRLAKYGVRQQAGGWKVTVLWEADDGLRYLAVEGGGHDLADRINALKATRGEKPGGAFYLNEFGHVLVPAAAPTSLGLGSVYYCAGRFNDEFRFQFEGKPLSTRPVDSQGGPLQPGARWIGPRPGIPYVLAAGGGDIYFETPALTEADPPAVRPNMTRRIVLSKVLRDREAVARAVAPIATIRGRAGGRFYVNEHGAIFTPVSVGDGNGLDYIYCGQIDRGTWFEEPAL